MQCKKIIFFLFTSAKSALYCSSTMILYSTCNSIDKPQVSGFARRHTVVPWVLFFFLVLGRPTLASGRRLIPSPSVLQSVALVNCGGPAYYDANTGLTWSANLGKTRNSVAVSTTAWINTTATNNTPAALYQTGRQFLSKRSGPYRMEIPVKSNNLTSPSYRVEMHFVETQNARRRIFTVMVQKQVLQQRFEILQAAGNAPFTAVMLAAQASVDENGMLMIDLIPIRYNPIISAIAVYELMPGSPSTPVPSTLPSRNPTLSPSPSTIPSHDPTISPRPSVVPSQNPTISPRPSAVPSQNPTKSSMPSTFPSHSPTGSPSAAVVRRSQTPSSSNIIHSSIWGSGRWIEVATNNTALERRHEACFVWVNGKAYLVGGRGQLSVNIYDPHTRVWSAEPGPGQQLHHMQCGMCAIAADLSFVKLPFVANSHTAQLFS